MQPLTRGNLLKRKKKELAIKLLFDHFLCMFPVFLPQKKRIQFICMIQKGKFTSCAVFLSNSHLPKRKEFGFILSSETALAKSNVKGHLEGYIMFQNLPVWLQCSFVARVPLFFSPQ